MPQDPLTAPDIRAAAACPGAAAVLWCGELPGAALPVRDSLPQAEAKPAVS